MHSARSCFRRDLGTCHVLSHPACFLLCVHLCSLIYPHVHVPVYVNVYTETQVFAWVKKAKDDVDASSPLGVSLSKLESMLSAAYLTGSAATVADYVTFASVFPLFALNGG